MPGDVPDHGDSVSSSGDINIDWEKVGLVLGIISSIIAIISLMVACCKNDERSNNTTSYTTSDDDTLRTIERNFSSRGIELSDRERIIRRNDKILVLNISN